MEYTEIDKIKVSRVCMGSWNITGDSTWGQQDEQDSIDTVKKALDCGINFFDTAEAYGNGYSEKLLGNILASRRKEVVIASKTAFLSPAEIIERCEKSLKRLKTDYIDIYYLHWPDWNIPVSETVEAAEKLLKSGKIRTLGVSNYGEKDLDEILKYHPVKINQLAYNLLFRAVEYEILPKCIENNIGVACYSPLAEGLLTGKFKNPEQVPKGRARTRHFSKEREMSRHKEEGLEQETVETIEKIRQLSEKIFVPMPQLALAWLLGRQGVKTVVAGARNPRQIEQNAQAASVDLSAEISEKLEKITADLKNKLGPNADMWLTESRIR
jgi:myo-inositol catabolism protein IolS